MSQSDNENQLIEKEQSKYTDGLTQHAWVEAVSKAPSEKFIQKRYKDKQKTKVLSRFVPIHIQQALADYVFEKIDILECDYKMISIQVGQNIVSQMTMQLKVIAYPRCINAEPIISIGVAAKPMQEAKNSLEYILPALKSAAYSNALTSMANIFGRNLNRKDVKDDYKM